MNWNDYVQSMNGALDMYPQTYKNMKGLGYLSNADKNYLSALTENQSNPAYQGFAWKPEDPGISSYDALQNMNKQQQDYETAQRRNSFMQQSAPSSATQSIIDSLMGKIQASNPLVYQDYLNRQQPNYQIDMGNQQKLLDQSKSAYDKALKFENWLDEWTKPQVLDTRTQDPYSTDSGGGE